LVFQPVHLNPTFPKQEDNYRKYYLKKTKYKSPKMLSEDFDKKIKEAADHHHPAYNEQAWKGMKKLLEKHMPKEKKKRKGFFFFLFMLLLTGGSAALLFKNHFSKKQNDTAVIKTPVSSESNGKNISPIVSQEKTALHTGNNSKPREAAIAKTPQNNDYLNETISPNINLPEQVPVKKQKVDAGIPPFIYGIKKTKAAKPTKGKEKNKSEITIQLNNNPAYKKDDTGIKPALPENNTINSSPIANSPVNITDKKQTTPPETMANTVVLPSQPVVNNIADKSNKPQNDQVHDSKQTGRKKPIAKKKNSFFLSISTGSDVSFISGDRLGKMKVLTGAGAGYTFKEKITLRSGFYTAKKIYTASPKNYNLSPLVSLYYPNLQKVEADCKIYEIPLSISYNFSSPKNSQLFATAGISSLIMKEEVYDYFYKYTPTSPTINHSYTYKNENKHFFSLLTLSAGYQRKFGNRFSLMAEPYIKLPLGGVGEGQVKLNSAGVLLSFTVNPFIKSIQQKKYN
jgi:hypothetical protein